MQWMADGIHEFTATDHQKNPSEELIIWWIIRVLSENSEKIVASTFLSVSKRLFLTLVFLCFLLPFFFLKCSLKGGAYYTYSMRTLYGIPQACQWMMASVCMGSYGILC